MIERAVSCRDVPLREKTILWRMLYETAARANEVLALKIENLGASRGVPLQLIMAKGSAPQPAVTAMRYVRLGAEAVAEVTALLDPPRRRG